MRAGQILTHLVGLMWVAAGVLVLTYASKFWIWQAPWGREGLFGIAWLPRTGDALDRLLRGTPFADYDLIVWGCGGIILLSLIAWITTILSGKR